MGHMKKAAVEETLASHGWTRHPDFQHQDHLYHQDHLRHIIKLDRFGPIGNPTKWQHVQYPEEKDRFDVKHTHYGEGTTHKSLKEHLDKFHSKESIPGKVVLWPEHVKALGAAVIAQNQIAHEIRASKPKGLRYPGGSKLGLAKNPLYDFY